MCVGEYVHVGCKPERLLISVFVLPSYVYSIGATLHVPGSLITCRKGSSTEPIDYICP